MDTWCVIGECGRPTYARLRCHKHYLQLWRRGLVKRGLVEGKIRPNGLICQTRGCDKPYYAKGYCRNHYTKVMRGSKVEKGLL